MADFFESMNKTIPAAAAMAMEERKWNKDAAMKHLDLFNSTGDPVHLLAYNKSMKAAGLEPPDTSGLNPSLEATAKIDSMARVKRFLEKTSGEKIEEVPFINQTAAPKTGLADVAGLAAAEEGRMIPTPMDRISRPYTVEEMAKEYASKVDPAQLVALHGKDVTAQNALQRIQETIRHNTETENRKQTVDLQLLDLKAKLLGLAKDREDRLAARGNGNGMDKLTLGLTVRDAIKQRSDAQSALKNPLFLMIDPNDSNSAMLMGEKKKLEDQVEEANNILADAGVRPAKSSPGKPGATMSQMPEPSQHSGRTVRDTASGKRYKSNGRAWVEVQ